MLTRSATLRSQTLILNFLCSGLILLLGGLGGKHATHRTTSTASIVQDLCEAGVHGDAQKLVVDRRQDFGDVDADFELG